MTGFTVQLSRKQREFLEIYRKQQGLYSMGDAARELLYLGTLSVADN